MTFKNLIILKLMTIIMFANEKLVITGNSKAIKMVTKNKPEMKEY